MKPTRAKRFVKVQVQLKPTEPAKAPATNGSGMNC